MINKNSDDQNIDLDNGFEVINNIDDNNFEKSFDRYYNGQLSSIEIESLLSSIITKRSDSKKEITIKPYTIGGSDINQLLDDLESQSDGSILTLIPYGITKRCFLLENHSVLVAIYQNRIYVIDPKSNWFYANPQINKKQYQQINLGIQRFYDRKNCGRYTVFIATKLVELFSHTDEDVFDLSEQVKSIENPNIKSLQEYYGNIIKENF